MSHPDEDISSSQGLFGMSTIFTFLTILTSSSWNPRKETSEGSLSPHPKNQESLFIFPFRMSIVKNRKADDHNDEITVIRTFIHLF